MGKENMIGEKIKLSLIGELTNKDIDLLSDGAFEILKNDIVKDFKACTYRTMVSYSYGRHTTYSSMCYYYMKKITQKQYEIIDKLITIERDKAYMRIQK